MDHTPPLDIECEGKSWRILGPVWGYKSHIVFETELHCCGLWVLPNLLLQFERIVDDGYGSACCHSETRLSNF